VRAQTEENDISIRASQAKVSWRLGTDKETDQRDIAGRHSAEVQAEAEAGIAGEQLGTMELGHASELDTARMTLDGHQCAIDEKEPRSAQALTPSPGQKGEMSPNGNADLAASRQHSKYSRLETR